MTKLVYVFAMCVLLSDGDFLIYDGQIHSLAQFKSTPVTVNSKIPVSRRRQSERVEIINFAAAAVHPANALRTAACECEKHMPAHTHTMCERERVARLRHYFFPSARSENNFAAEWRT